MPNDPYLDASVHWKIRSGNIQFHELRYDEAAESILDSGLATEVVRRIGSGKEADVYLCLDGSTPIAVKSYRFYRTSHRGGRPIKADSMGRIASDEFDMLVHAWRQEVRVPTPIQRVENMFSMQYLGTLDAPAPQLNQIRLEDPESFCTGLLVELEEMAAGGLVHSDMSAFNILVYQGRAWIIDLAKCVRVDRLGASPWIRLTEATAALRLGLKGLATYFRKYGIKVDTEELVSRVIQRLDRFNVMA